MLELDLGQIHVYLYLLYLDTVFFKYLYLDTFVQNEKYLYLNFLILFRYISNTMYITDFAGNIPLVN